jgi:hypothetical protein
MSVKPAIPSACAAPVVSMEENIRTYELHFVRKLKRWQPKLELQSTLSSQYRAGEKYFYSSRLPFCIPQISTDIPRAPTYELTERPKPNPQSKSRS